MVGVGTLVEVPVFVLSLVDLLKSPGSTKIAARTSKKGSGGAMLLLLHPNFAIIKSLAKRGHSVFSPYSSLLSQSI